ncbi:MAG: hypothetical protein M3Y59_13710 [Myxococcota bacterium]|nr:hypothetical protein [Myxococcota bacterium]
MTVLAMVVAMSLGMGHEPRTFAPPATRQFSLGLTPAATPASPVAPGLEVLLSTDKLLHMSISANLALGSVALARAFGVSKRWALVIGAATALGAGLLKELWDLRGNGQAEWADLGADVIGTTAGVSVSLIFGTF